MLAAGCATVAPPPEGSPWSGPTPLSSPTPAPSPEPPPFSLVAGGDVTPAGGLRPYLEKSGPDYPYVGLAPFFQSADAGLVNLECPLSNRGKALRGKKFTFRARPSAAPALRHAGITVVALANNHVLDYGPLALSDTLLALDAAGVAHTGAGKNLAASRRPACLTLPGGQTLAVLSYSLTYPAAYWASPTKPGTAPGDVRLVQADVDSACAWATAVVVCFHWGGELIREPRSYQTDLGHAAIDAGAALVVGTHPHILQGVEWYHDGVILYSLGNLAFGGGVSRRAVRSALFKIDFSPEGAVDSVRARGLSVDNRQTRFQPTPLAGAENQAWAEDLRRLSEHWGTRVALTEDDWADLEPPAEPGSDADVK
jgi:poly-gamma-glutamate capsule biosynthesis protein CapA/YwtB (metallophosphatase superfamily)